MKVVSISAGLAVTVDDEDFDRVAAFHWSVKWGRSGEAYAIASIQGRSIFLHRFLLGAKRGQIVDHIDRNTLNNQRANLRFVNRSQSSCNRRAWSKSGFKGVFWDKDRHKWTAQITTNGVMKKLGYFASAEEAAHARDRAAIRLHGPYAFLNFPDQLRAA